MRRLSAEAWSPRVGHLSMNSGHHLVCGQIWGLQIYARINEDDDRHGKLEQNANSRFAAVFTSQQTSDCSLLASSFHALFELDVFSDLLDVFL